MNSVKGIAVGRVFRVTNVESQNGKPYLAINCEMSPRVANGKTYTDRFEVRVYSENNIAELALLQKGDWITADGNAGASAFEWEGKWYGRLTIIGRASMISNAQPAPQEPAPPAPPPRAQPAPVAARPVAARQPAPKPADDLNYDDGDPVPF